MTTLRTRNRIARKVVGNNQKGSRASGYSQKRIYRVQLARLSLGAPLTQRRAFFIGISVWDICRSGVQECGLQSSLSLRVTLSKAVRRERRTARGRRPETGTPGRCEGAFATTACPRQGEESRNVLMGDPSLLWPLTVRPLDRCADAALRNAEFFPLEPMRQGSGCSCTASGSQLAVQLLANPGKRSADFSPQLYYGSGWVCTPTVFKISVVQRLSWSFSMVGTRITIRVKPQFETCTPGRKRECGLVCRATKHQSTTE
jgi:hypothetical protein